MAAIYLTDGSGRFFEESTATLFEPGTEESETFLFIPIEDIGIEPQQALYLTASGKWIMKIFGDNLGTQEAYNEITHKEAGTWLLSHLLDTLPTYFQL